MAASILPKCPFCDKVLDPKTDILWDIAGRKGMWVWGVPFLYCGFCGAVLGGGAGGGFGAPTISKTSRG